MEKLYLCLPSFLEDWQNKRLNISQENYKAFLEQSKDKKEDDIYDIEDDTMIININGPLSNSGPDWIDKWLGYGGTSYKDILDALELADDEQIKNIKLLMDTPGGEVGIVDNVWQKAFDLRNKGKNITAINKDTMASAGYWIASAANKILSDGKTNITGSIGVAMTAVDYTNAYKKIGVIVKDILSSNAKNKWPDIKTKEGLSVLQEQVDVIENIFHDRIMQGRGITREKIINDFGQGKIFIAENPDLNGVDAIRIGMIDGLVKKPDAVATGKNKPAANAGAKQTEVKVMNLKELMASDPALKAEVETLIAEKYNAGLAEGKTEEQNRIKAIMPFLQSESYDNSFKAQLFKGLTGEYSVETVRAMVGMEDARIEREKSEAAKSNKEGNTNVPAGETITAVGEITKELDISAEAKRLKALREGK